MNLDDLFYQLESNRRILNTYMAMQNSELMHNQDLFVQLDKIADDLSKIEASIYCVAQKQKIKYY